jgi:hypothetical protein
VDEITKVLYERGQVCPEIFQTDLVGHHPPNDTYAYLGPSIVYTEGYEGQLPWRYVPSAKRADMRTKLWLPVSKHPDAPQWRWRWLTDFLNLSDPSVTHPLMAWVAASARRHEAREFPLLFVSGSSGVGKSTLARLALKMSGSDIETDLAAVTEFALVTTLAATSNIPVFVDEWTRLSKKRTREAFQSYVPALYAGSYALRGQADLSLMSYKLTAPVIVAGEDTFTLDRERDRVVRIRPTRAAQNHAALAAIERAPLYTFAARYHKWLVSPSAQGLPSLAYSAGNRPDHNRDVLLAGWASLRAFVEAAKQYDADAPDLPVEPDLSCLDVDPDEMETENVYEQALAEGLAITDSNGAKVVWPDPAGRGTWVRAKVLIGLIESKRIDIELPGRSRAMLDYFRERYDKVVHMTGAAPPFNSTVAAALIYGLHIAQYEGDTEEEPTAV